MLSQDPTEIGVTAETFPYPVFGILMETGIAEGTFTLACLADGTTSLYLSDGSGTIGGGHHDAVRRAAEYLLAGAQHYYAQADSVSTHPTPEVGMVIFYFLGFDGVRAYGAPEEELVEGRDELSQLFLAGHGVLTALRKVEQELPNA